AGVGELETRCSQLGFGDRDDRAGGEIARCGPGVRAVPAAAGAEGSGIPGSVGDVDRRSRADRREQHEADRIARHVLDTADMRIVGILAVDLDDGDLTGPENTGYHFENPQSKLA